MKSLRLAVLGATAAALLVPATVGGAEAKEVKLAGIFGWLAVGQITMIDKGHAYWTGQFSGAYTDTDPKSPLNGTAWQCPGFNDVGTMAAGYCVITDGAGDALYAKWQNDGGFPVAKGSYTYTGGTGKFTGATGGGKFTGHFAGPAHPDGTQSGFTDFSEASLTMSDK